MAVPGSFTGFKKNPQTGYLDLYYAGTNVGSFNATDAKAKWLTTTTLLATTTITAGTGLTVTTGNETNTAGDHMVTAGNARLGVVSTFATTEPTSAYVMKQGTAPVGAITTSGGIYTDGTIVAKIIADGTASNIET